MLLNPEDQNYNKTDISFSLGHATAISLGITPIIGVVVLGLYVLIWGTDSLVLPTPLFRRLHILLPIIVISIVVHEALHWLGYVACAHLSWRTVRFGFNLRFLSAYVHADSPVSASAYRCLVGLPMVFLGAIPVVIGIAWEVGWITLYGFLMLIASSGDITILWKIRRVEPDSLVMDHPSRAGCWVLTERSDAHTDSSNVDAQAHL